MFSPEGRCSDVLCSHTVARGHSHPPAPRDCVSDVRKNAMGAFVYILPCGKFIFASIKPKVLRISVLKVSRIRKTSRISHIKGLGKPYLVNVKIVLM